MWDVSRFVALCVAAGLCGACGKRQDPAQTTAPAARPPAVAPSTRAPGVTSRGAAAAPTANVPGGEESSVSIITECPTRPLRGEEKRNRVIGKSCGVVVVAAPYHLNRAQLTLEAGATLAFEEGASLNVGYY